MSLRPTTTNLKKLEELLEALEYSVRYEKGHFNSGYCIVENKKIAVINKFFDTEGRVGCFLDILSKIEVDREKFSPEQALFFQKLFDNSSNA